MRLEAAETTSGSWEEVNKRFKEESSETMRERAEANSASSWRRATSTRLSSCSNRRPTKSTKRSREVSERVEREGLAEFRLEFSALVRSEGRGPGCKRKGAEATSEEVDLALEVGGASEELGVVRRGVLDLELRRGMLGDCCLLDFFNDFEDVPFFFFSLFPELFLLLDSPGGNLYSVSGLLIFYF